MNRFNEILPNQQYISSHVPLPLDQIVQMGAMKQGQFDDVSKKVATSTDPLAKYDVNASLKVYGANGIQDDSLGFEERKRELVSTISAKRDKIAGALASGQMDPKDPAIYQLQREAVAAADELAGYADVAKQVKSYNEEFGKNDDYGKQNYLGQGSLQYNTDFLNSIRSGKVSGYNPVGISATTNRVEEVSKYAAGVGEDALSNYIGTSARPGYIYEFNKSGRTKNKIESGFDSWYENSSTKDDVRMEAKHEAALRHIKVDDKITVKIPQYDDSGKLIGTETKEVKFGDYFEAQKKQDLLDQAKTHSTSKINQAQKGDWMAQRAYDEEAAKPKIKSTMAPGATEASPQLLGGVPISEYFKKANGQTVTDVSGNPVVDYEKLTEAFNKGLGSSAGSQAVGMLAPGAGMASWKKLFSEGSGYAKPKPLTSSEFQTKIINFGKIMGLKSVPETLAYLQNVSTSAKSVVLPAVEIAQGMEVKVDQQFNKAQMKNKDGITLESLTPSGTTSNFRGMDLSDKNNPRFAYEMTDANGVKTYETFSIPDDNYKNALKPIATIVNDVQDILLRKTTPKASEITEGSDILIRESTKSPRLASALGVNGTSDLAPVGVRDLGNSTLYIYHDKTRPGEVRALEINHTSKTVKPIRDFGEYIITRTDEDFTSEVAADILRKKKVESHTEEPE